MAGPGDQIRRRIDDLLFERLPTPARLTAAGLLVLAGIGLAARLWGPPASVGARTPPSGTRFRVGGFTWVMHLERGLLLVRRAPAAVVPRVPSTG